MRIELKKRINAECIHFWEPRTNTMIASKGNRVWVTVGNSSEEFRLPVRSNARPFLLHRMGRRLRRLDKMNAFFIEDRQAIVSIYQGEIFTCDLRSKRVEHRHSLRQSRNSLHSAVCVLADDRIFLGEYGHNAKRHSVPLWTSDDKGQTWKIAYEFPAGSIKHVHGVYRDPFGSSLFIPTGDFAGECFLFEYDPSSGEMKRHGDGSQNWRAVSLLFEPEAIVWGMDTPLQEPRLQVFSRKTSSLQQGQAFPGSVWYTKALADGLTLLETSCEPGEAIKSRHAHIYVSEDRRDWLEVKKWKKDFWPMDLFKYGVIAFADGEQTSDDFAIFGEALTGFDGVAYLASVV